MRGRSFYSCRLRGGGRCQWVGGVVTVVGFSCGWMVDVSDNGCLRVGGGLQWVGGFVTVGEYRLCRVHSSGSNSEQNLVEYHLGH